MKSDLQCEELGKSKLIKCKTLNSLSEGSQSLIKEGESVTEEVSLSSILCEKCGRNFKSEATLQAHSKMHNSENKKFKCQECDSLFRDISRLRLHIRMHCKDLQYTCRICKKGFPQASRLSRHLKTHSSEKPYMCEFCDKSFREKRNFENHLASLHPDEKKAKKKSHVCSHCSKSFLELNSLNRHLRCHNNERPHLCSDCGKKFIDNASLKRHCRIHNNDKPFQCEMCGKAFAQSNNLKAHVKIHTQEKPYVCELCGKRFNQKSNLNTHSKRASCTKRRVKLEKEPISFNDCSPIIIQVQSIQVERDDKEQNSNFEAPCAFDGATRDPRELLQKDLQGVGGIEDHQTDIVPMVESHRQYFSFY